MSALFHPAIKTICSETGIHSHPGGSTPLLNRSYAVYMMQLANDKNRMDAFHHPPIDHVSDALIWQHYTRRSCAEVAVL